MTKLWNMTSDELERYTDYCIREGNLQALTEIHDYHKWYGKMVKVVKGRKCPKGTTGRVFYVERKHYGTNPWFGWSTRVGFRDDDGNAYFTNEDNLEIVDNSLTDESKEGGQNHVENLG